MLICFKIYFFNTFVYLDILLLQGLTGPIGDLGPDGPIGQKVSA